VSRIRATALEDLLTEAWTGPAWHGPSLRQVVHTLTPEAAIARVDRASHSAWALILHAAYWKHRVWCRITGARGSRFARRPSNFPAPPTEPDPGRWREDLDLLDAHAGELLTLAATLRDRDLGRRAGRYTVEASLRGIALHDIYHAGQIRMLQRMLDRKPL
jgi:uncharacterized damage-inducible protein DinB